MQHALVARVRIGIEHARPEDGASLAWRDREVVKLRKARRPPRELVAEVHEEGVLAASPRRGSRDALVVVDAVRLACIVFEELQVFRVREWDTCECLDAPGDGVDRRVVEAFRRVAPERGRRANRL